MSDRTVHGRTASGAEVVRYARSGKWFIESADGQRRRVGVFDAAHAAALGRVVRCGGPDGRGELASDDDTRTVTVTARYRQGRSGPMSGGESGGATRCPACGVEHSDAARAMLAGGEVVEYARCPECGGEIRGFDFTAGVIEVTETVEPAWEGGPLVWVPLSTPMLRPDPARDVWAAKPCGHRVKRKDVWVKVTRAGGGGEGACRG